MNKSIFLFLFYILISSCIQGQNIRDENGLKQGYWSYTEKDTVILNHIFPYNKVDTIYGDFIKVGGHFIDDKKEGVWISRYGITGYSSNTDTLSVFNFKNDMPIDEFIVFYKISKRLMYRGVCASNLKKTVADVRGTPNSNFVGKSMVNVLELVEKWSFVHLL